MSQKTLFVFAVLASLGLHAGDSVWTDAVLHIRGGRDRNGDGYFQPNPGKNDYASGTTEIPDVRHEAQKTPQSNKIWYRTATGVTGSDVSEVRHQTMDVVSAAQGVTLKDQPCLYFPAGNYMDGTTQKHYPISFLMWGGIDYTHPSYPISGNKWTLLTRVKVPELTSFSATDNITSWFWGTSTAATGVTGGGEIRIGFRKNTAQNSLPYVNVALGNNTNPEQGNVNCAFEFGEWIEVAVVFDGDKKNVRVSCGRPGMIRRWGNISTSTFPLRPMKSMYLGSVRNAVQTYNDDFRGYLHMFAMWNRALTDEEVMEAFGGPAGNLVRIGEEGCTQELHVGATATGAVTLDQTAADQRNWPAAVGTGAVLKIPFAVDKYRAGLNQVLRLLPRAGSGSGKFAIDIDGTNHVGRIEVRAREASGAADPSFYFVNGALLTEGAHELKLTRLDTRTTPVKFDVIELGGSWRAGLEDGERPPNSSDGMTGGMSAYDGADMWYPASQNQADFTTYTAYKTTGNRHTGITWRVPDGLAAKATYTIRADRLWHGGSIEHVMALNAAALGSVNFSSATYQTYDLPKGKLVNGLNVIDCYYVDKTDGPWVVYDAFTCEVTGCESDKAKFGLAILLR